MEKQLNEIVECIAEISKRLDKIEATLKRIDETNTVDDVRFQQIPLKTVKEILDG